MATPTTLPASFVAGNVLTAAQLNDLRGAFRILQIASANKANDFSTTSATYVDVTDLSVSITPSATSSKVLVLATVQVSNTAGDGAVQLVRDSTAIALGTTGTAMNGYGQVSSSYQNSMFTCGIVYLDSPNTTSATTYKIQARVNGGTTFINRRFNTDYGGYSTITVCEVSA